MTKIVINACFGGFNLSLTATKWLANKGCQEATETLEDSSSYIEYEGEKSFMGFRPDTLARHDALLVECVEALGEAASGSCAKLVVETIEGNRYRIDEYDGAEGIETPESMEWITVE